MTAASSGTRKPAWRQASTISLPKSSLQAINPMGRGADRSQRTMDSRTFFPDCAMLSGRASCTSRIRAS